MGKGERRSPKVPRWKDMRIDGSNMGSRSIRVRSKGVHPAREMGNHVFRYASCWVNVEFK